MTTKNSLQDICIWSCDVWCYRHELHEYGWLSDDYIVIKEGSLMYPDGITVFEEDLSYDNIVKTRLLMQGLCKGD